MAQPTPYNKATDFTEYAIANPTATFPPAGLDSELDAIETTLAQTTSNLAIVQRDDGALRNGIVNVESLSAATVALIASEWTPRGEWLTATNYAVGDLASESGRTYVCAQIHTSGTFATDLAAGIWMLLSVAGSEAASISFSPVGSIASTNVQAAVAELDASHTVTEASLSALYADGGAANITYTPAAVGAAEVDLQTRLRTGDLLVRVSSISALKNTTPQVGSTAMVSGYYSASDGGGGTFWWDSASTATDDGGMVIALAGGGTGRWKRIVTGVLSVKDFGAVGDGVTDDTAAIQAAINASSVLYWPPGKYRATSTLTFPTSAPYGGGKWLGAGGLVGDPRTTTRDPNYTALIWDGAAGGTMIAYEGTLGFEFEQLCFVGQDTSGGAAKAGIILHVKYNGTYGSGETTFTHCSWIDATVGVQCGTLLGDGGCAGLNFIKPVFDRCTKGLYVKNSQGLNYTMHHVTAGNCVSVVDCEAGGNLFVYGGSLYTCGGTGADDYPFRLQALGSNIAGNIIDGVRIEQNTKRFLQAKGTGIVHVRGFTEAQTDQNVSMFDIRGPKVIIDGCRLVSNDTTNPTFLLQHHTGGQRYGLSVRDTWFDVASWAQNDWIALTDVNDESFVSIEKCRYGTNELPLPDIFSRLEHGGWTGFVQTTDATATQVYFDGGASAVAANTCRTNTDTTYLVYAYVVGRKSDGTAVGTFVRRACIVNASGTASVSGSVETVGTDINADSWGGVTINASGAFFRVQVTGKLATTIDWRVRIVAEAMKAI